MLSVCLCATHSLVLSVVLNWSVEGNLTMLTDRVWGGTIGAGAAPTAPKLPAATGRRTRINVVCLFTAKCWRWAKDRLRLRCLGDR